MKQGGQEGGRSRNREDGQGWRAQHVVGIIHSAGTFLPSRASPPPRPRARVKIGNGSFMLGETAN